MLCVLVSAVPSGAAEPTFTIDRQGDHLVVEAEGAAVEKVVAGLGQRAGFDVSILSGAERPPVDGRIEGETVTAVLQKVLRDRNYALVYDDSDGQRLERVLLLSPPPQHRWVPKTVSRAPNDSSLRKRQMRAERIRQRRAAARRAAARQRRAR